MAVQAPREQREDAQAVREELLRMFTEHNHTLTDRAAVPACLVQTQWMLPTRLPDELPPGDDRINVSKKKRVFVCDDCRQVVTFSSLRNETLTNRDECEFAGSFISHGWEDLPDWIRKTAWENRLIVATWNCSHTCQAPTTLNERQKQLRRDRNDAWKQERQGQEPQKGGKSCKSAGKGAGKRSSYEKGKGGKRRRTGK